MGLLLFIHPHSAFGGTMSVPDEIRERVAKALHDHGAWCGDCDYEGWHQCVHCRRVCLAYADTSLAVLDRDALIAMLGACPTDAAETSSSPESPMVPVGYISPHVAYEHKFHTSCRGQPQKQGQSLYYDHSAWFAVYRFPAQEEDRPQ